MVPKAWSFSSLLMVDYAGRHEEELEIARAELVRADWTVEVPELW